MAENGPQYQPQVVGSCMNQIALGNILQSAQGHSAQVAASFEHGKASFDNFGTKPAQTLAFVYAGAAPVGVKFPAGRPVATRQPL